MSDPGRASAGYDGSSVFVMARNPCNGNANQLWIYDQDSGFISAFATDAMNLGNITRHLVLESPKILTCSMLLLLFKSHSVTALVLKLKNCIELYSY